MTRGVQVVMSTHINSVLDALMSALIAVDIDTAWRFLTKRWVVVMDTTAIHLLCQKKTGGVRSGFHRLSSAFIGDEFCLQWPPRHGALVR